MRRLARRFLGTLCVGSVILCAACAALWVRSPAVFDRLSWTTPSGNLWEITSLWGDVAVVRVARWPVRQRMRWQQSRLYEAAEIAFWPIANEAAFTYFRGAGVSSSGEDPPHTWRRSFSSEAGAVVVGGFSSGRIQLRFRRLTFPFWLPVVLFGVLPTWAVLARLRRQKAMSPPERVPC